MPNLDCNIFCERAKELFGERGQIDLAESIGISQGVISAIKRNAPKAPSADTVYRIAKYFNVSADWLLGLSDVKSTDKATKELCDTLGLSEQIISFLKGDPVFHSFDEFTPYSIEEEVTRTVNLLNWLITEHIECLQERFGRSSLLKLLSNFFILTKKDDNIQISVTLDGEIDVFVCDEKTRLDEHIYSYKQIKQYRIPTENIQTPFCFGLKECLTTSTIQEINSYLVNLTNKQSEVFNKYGNDTQT